MSHEESTHRIRAKLDALIGKGYSFTPKDAKTFTLGDASMMIELKRHRTDRRANICDITLTVTGEGMPIDHSAWMLNKGNNEFIKATNTDAKGTMLFTDVPLNQALTLHHVRKIFANVPVLPTTSFSGSFSPGGIGR